MSETEVHPKRMGTIRDTCEGWVIEVVDDQHIPDGRRYAPNLSVTISHGEVIQQGSYPSYRIWTLLAHWQEGIPYERAPVPAGGSGGERG